MAESAAPAAGVDMLIARLRDRDPDVCASVMTLVEGFRRPPPVQLVGRIGVGLRSVARAMQLPGAVLVRLDSPDAAADPPEPSNPTIYVLAEQLHPVEEAALAAAAPDLVVVNKVDAIGWREGMRRAERYATHFDVPGLPLVASTAVAAAEHVLTSDEHDALRNLAATADPLLLLSADLFTGRGPLEAAMRRELLDRWDLFGVRCAVEAVRNGADLDAPALTEHLRACCGAAALRPTIDQLLQRTEAARAHALLSGLARLGVRSRCRDEIEEFLCSPAAARLRADCRAH